MFLENNIKSLNHYIIGDLNSDLIKVDALTDECLNALLTKGNKP